MANLLSGFGSLIGRFLRLKKFENVTIFLQKSNQEVNLFKEQYKMKKNSSLC